MRISLILALLSFYIAHLLCHYFTIPFDPVVPVTAAIAVFIISQRWKALINNNRDKPETFSYKMSALQAYALIKGALETFKSSERKWQIEYCDPKALSIMAVSEWREYAAWARPKGLIGSGRYLSRQVFLDIQVFPPDTNSTNVELSRKITAEFSREECDKLQDLTREAIKKALQEGSQLS